MAEDVEDGEPEAVTPVTRPERERGLALSLAFDMRTANEEPSDIVVRAETFLAFLKG
jgi:hypothetical protein